MHDNADCAACLHHPSELKRPIRKSLVGLRYLGIVIGIYPPGPLNAITDVAGVKVGQTTLMSGEGPFKPGLGPIRTGVTVVIPRDDVWLKKVPCRVVCTQWNR